MQELITKYKELRHAYIEYQDSASWYAYNQVCIILENSSRLEQATDEMTITFGLATNQDAREIYGQAWDELRLLERIS